MFFVRVSTSCYLVLGRVISVAVEILVGEGMKVQIRHVEIVTCDHYISDITFCDKKYLSHTSDTSDVKLPWETRPKRTFQYFSIPHQPHPQNPPGDKALYCIAPLTGPRTTTLQAQ